MKKGIVVALLLFFAFSISSFGVHKFYMAIYQINYAPEKKMLQVTSRIFVDDLNKTLEKKYNRKFFLGTDKETVESLDLLKKYLAENFTIKVNGQPKTMNFLSKEMDGDVLVCYLNVKEISKINALEIYNSVLIDCFAEQQNIVHVTAFSTKKSFLFTESSTKQVLKY
ncbi:hypothetical protein C8C85_1039 [Flavobacterium sp. 103]|uniref:DUF6702 family protein n=1 Tax=unclassified Flavobacterium TaxID=196869 RepID=UPI000D5CD1DF|nr:MULTISPECIES: DUF6702 family protein [unclassified Flavobacterium]PVX45256.1 hypothetical protein C8C85_1039 [Flavobacterium sp. 103]QKJ62591.1 hypothetical protein HQN62_05405 [Flavobacterium sp. M31R6]